MNRLRKASSEIWGEWIEIIIWCRKHAYSYRSFW
jgi:hypothetical protein